MKWETFCLYSWIITRSLFLLFFLDSFYLILCSRYQRLLLQDIIIRNFSYWVWTLNNNPTIWPQSTSIFQCSYPQNIGSAVAPHIIHRLICMMAYYHLFWMPVCSPHHLSLCVCCCLLICLSLSVAVTLFLRGWFFSVNLSWGDTQTFQEHCYISWC